MTSPTPRTRTGPVLAGLAAVLALWLGLTAPSTSPVQPPLPATAAVAPATGPVVPGQG